MKKIIVTLLLLPLLTFAEAGELTVGGQTISYDSSTQIDSGVLFYSGEELVASEHGVVMVVYEDDRAVIEAHDISGDGEFDTFISLDAEGEVTKIEGEGADAFERPETVEFAELLAADGGSSASTDEDLVGSVDSISIPGSGNYTFYIITVVFLAVAYWWHRRGKKDDDEE